MFTPVDTGQLEFVLTSLRVLDTRFSAILLWMTIVKDSHHFVVTRAFEWMSITHDLPRSLWLSKFLTARLSFHRIDYETASFLGWFCVVAYWVVPPLVCTIFSSNCSFGCWCMAGFVPSTFLSFHSHPVCVCVAFKSNLLLLSSASWERVMMFKITVSEPYFVRTIYLILCSWFYQPSVIFKQNYFLLNIEAF